VGCQAQEQSFGIQAFCPDPIYEALCDRIEDSMSALDLPQSIVAYTEAWLQRLIRATRTVPLQAYHNILWQMAYKHNRPRFIKRAITPSLLP
jgi:hypothetical protein